jgi:hypothetical protein
VSVRTHHAKGRSLVAAAPLIGVGMLVFAYLQGEHDMVRSHAVQVSVFAVAALGFVVAAWTAWRLGSAPAVPVAQARPGRVSLRGHAEALPNAAPLLSPDGVACLWFTHSQQVVRRYDAFDSVRPFLIVDASGSCVVLPAGAEIDGSSKIVEAKQVKLSDPTDITGHGARYGTGERLLCVGDELHVHGWFTPASAEAIEMQLQAGVLNQRVEQPSLVIRSDNEADFAKALAARPATLPPVAPPAAPLALPVVAGHGAEPFIVSIGSQDGEAGLYGFLAIADLLLACAAAACYLFVAPLPL